MKMMDELVDFGVSYFLDKSILVSSDHIFNGPGATYFPVATSFRTGPGLWAHLDDTSNAHHKKQLGLAGTQGIPILGSQN